MRMLRTLLRRAALPALLLAGSLAARAQQLYAVRDVRLTYADHPQASASVLVDGRPDPTRTFFQDYMKTTFRLPFVPKLQVGGGTALTALPATSAFGGRSVVLTATFTAATDSTTEVALFGTFTDDTPLTPEAAPAEYQLLRQAMLRYAPAARQAAYQQQVADAEAAVAAADKEREKLLGTIQATQQRLATEARQLHQDSTSLQAHDRQTAVARRLLQRHRARLTPETARPPATR